MNPYIYTASYFSSPPIQRGCRVGGDKVVVGMVVKAKVVDVEDEVREVFTRSIRKYLTCVVQGLSGNRRFLEIFKYGREKDMNSNQLTVVTIENSPVN